MDYLQLNRTHDRRNPRTKRINAALQLAFEPHSLKFNLLFEDGFSSEVKLTDEMQLVQMLLDGEGIYWDLVKTDTKILRVEPYSREQVIENLTRQIRLESLSDVFYDFQERQRE